MTKHTPGPWGAFSIRAYRQWSDDDPMVRTTSTRSFAVRESGNNIAEDTANAKLIAAAPTMLSVLQRIDAYMKGNPEWEEALIEYPSESDENTPARIARAAIKAATE